MHEGGEKYFLDHGFTKASSTPIRVCRMEGYVDRVCTKIKNGHKKGTRMCRMGGGGRGGYEM